MFYYPGKSQFMFSLITGHVSRKNVVFDDKLLIIILLKCIILYIYK